MLVGVTCVLQCVSWCDLCVAVLVGVTCVLQCVSWCELCVTVC